MAKWLCGTSDRHHAPRVPGPGADLWRVALAASSCFVCGVLQSGAYALGITERCALPSRSSALWCHCRHSDPGRAASPIRPDMIFGKDTLVVPGGPSNRSARERGVVRLQICQRACPCAIMGNKAFNSRRLPLPNMFDGRLRRGRHRSTLHRAAADWRDGWRNWSTASRCQQSQRGQMRYSRPRA